MYFHLIYQEAVRTGNLQSVKTLISAGADVNSRTKNKNGSPGGSILYFALEYLDQDHEVVKVLKSWGAKVARPGGPVRDEL